jgi:plastocyanin
MDGDERTLLMPWTLRYRQHLWVGSISAVVIAATLAVQAMSDSAALVRGATSATIATSSMAPQGDPPVDLQLTVREWTFEPVNLRLPAGRQATLHFANAGRLQHILVIPEAGVRLPVAPGQSDFADVAFDRPGTYTFSCEILDHKDLGMFGKVVVTPR